MRAKSWVQLGIANRYTAAGAELNHTTTDTKPEYTRVSICKSTQVGRTKSSPAWSTQLTREQYGIGVPNGEVAKTAEEAEAIAKKIGIIYSRKKCCGTTLTSGRW